MNELIFEDITIEDAYKKAAKSLDCFVADIEFEIIQEASGGFLGLFRKNAIVKVVKYKKRKSDTFSKKSKIKIQKVDKELDNLHNTQIDDKVEKPIKIDKKEDIIFDDFYKNEEQKLNEEEVIKEVKNKINQLFSKICFNIDEIEVTLHDKETLYIKFDGSDAALLIGKEGYRYKALSYILFNWIYDKYGYKIKLEVAEFLKNQENSIEAYLNPAIEIIKRDKFYKTKPLDGILVTIALNKLKERFPNMYIAVKTNSEGKKYIVVNEFKNDR